MTRAESPIIFYTCFKNLLNGQLESQAQWFGETPTGESR